MKKSLIALAVLAASGAAMAQSSVTLFGIVDAAVQYTNGDGNGNVTKLASGSESASRIGFRGVEDLGGGLKAGFHLEGGLTVDDGTAAGLNFTRRSTISLMGNFGEVRVGRDYVPTFNNLNAFSPFGTVGVGAVTNLNLARGVFAANTNNTRANNTIGYFLPGNLGGFYGQVQYAFGETASNAANKDDGNTIGLRVGYANGPLNVSGAYGETKIKAQNDAKSYGIGASYDFGVVKAFAQYTREELGSISAAGKRENDFYMLGVTAPVGPGTIKATYGKVDQNAAAGNNDADQWAIGYVYDLSKRTAVYGTYARIDNKGASTLYNNGRATTQAGGATSGLEVGVRHSF